ncbi:MAG TPA: SDR family oxidoreductase [Acidimicrobiales bacterium]|jgi:NAD(P)-dependent dehydrogenase (short-subunit alcohol dehydrogenase family)
MDLELAGKRAIVTGGSRGIGKAVARQLALEGALVGIAARDQGRIDDAVAELSAGTGRSVVGRSCDTTDDASVRAMVADLADQLGGVDILVNAAAMPGGVVAPPKLADITTDALWEEVNTKVMGYLRCAREAAPFMVAGGWGRIINISGLAARQTGSTLGSIRNVAVAAMTKNLADELGPSGINVTVVHPGPTRTERMSDETAARVTGNVIGRVVEADEIAYVVAFLASPKSAAVTGDAIACGGGARGAIHY